MGILGRGDETSALNQSFEFSDGEIELFIAAARISRFGSTDKARFDSEIWPKKVNDYASGLNAD